MTLHDIIQKNSETFEKDFVVRHETADPVVRYTDAIKIKQFLLSSQLSIIQAIDLWASLKLNVLYDSYGYEDGEPEVSAKIETLSQLRSFLGKAKNKLQ